MAIFGIVDNLPTLQPGLTVSVGVNIGAAFKLATLTYIYQELLNGKRIAVLGSNTWHYLTEGTVARAFLKYENRDIPLPFTETDVMKTWNAMAAEKHVNRIMQVESIDEYDADIILVVPDNEHAAGIITEKAVKLVNESITSQTLDNKPAPSVPAVILCTHKQALREAGVPHVNIITLDTTNSCVEVFKPDGNLLRKISVKYYGGVLDYA